MLSAVEQIETALKDLRDQMGSIRKEFLNSRFIPDENNNDLTKLNEQTDEKTSQRKPLRDYSGL